MNKEDVECECSDFGDTLVASISRIPAVRYVTGVHQLIPSSPEPVNTNFTADCVMLHYTTACHDIVTDYPIYRGLEDVALAVFPYDRPPMSNLVPMQQRDALGTGIAVGNP